MIEPELKAALREMRRVVVAFSGGVDSAVVLAAAVAELGSDALAVTATSPSVAQGEVEGAAALAKSLGAVHEVIETREFHDPRYRANPENRCFYCKEELYGRLDSIARGRNYRAIVDGCNADDGRAPLDRRPGRAAALALGVRSPLAELGIGKDAVRELAAHFGLSVWNKPATPCLSSRVPYGMRIELDDLRRIDLAEQYLRATGFATVRVRHFGERARVEVPAQDLQRLGDMSERVARALGAIGYREVEIDPRGYRVGSLNEHADRRAIGTEPHTSSADRSTSDAKPRTSSVDRSTSDAKPRTSSADRSASGD